MEYIEITSRKNKTILAASMIAADKKARDSSGLFAVEGIKLLEEAVLESLDIESIFFTQKALKLYGEFIEKVKCEGLYLVSDEVYEKMSDEISPQGVFACVRKKETGVLTDKELTEGGFVILEDIQNPLNIGAVLRCAFSMGFEKIIFTKGCADIYSPKCARAAMGSLFKIKAFYTDDIENTVRRIAQKGNKIYCTRLDEKSLKLGSVEFSKKDSFVIGNEGHGVKKELAEACTHSLYIPMNTGAESLNAATAAAIVMWEMRRNNI